MARLDMTGLVDLWNRIGDVFARKLEAAGSIVLSGTSIVMSSLTGSQLASLDLGNTFATNSYVQNNAIMSAGIGYDAGTSLITIRFYNALGVEVDSVSFTVS